MGGLSFIHILIFATIIGAWVIPCAIILGRLGFSRLWALLTVLPLATIVLFWVIALIEWPIADARERF